MIIESRGDEQLRRLMDKLHQFNVSSYVHIPEIAVMGDTSSGKSSALSQIGQIELPTNDKITTRCPTRLRMEKKEGLPKATVGIKWDKSSAYSKGKEAPVIEVADWGLDAPFG